MALTTPHSAYAQDQEPTQVSEAEGAEFLGTIELGSSKREVQTDTAIAVTIIDQEEISDRQASTIGELIETVPGVDLNGGSTPNGSGLNIRGFGSNTVFGTDQKIAVVIDGANTGSEEIYRVGTQLFTDPNLYKSVEVIRGTAGSFEYGTGIIGGTVKLETKDASDFTGGEVGFNVALNAGYFSNENGLNGSAIIAWQPSENFEFLANAAYREQDNQEDGDNNIIPGTEFELPSFLVKMRLTEGSHSFSASYNQTTSADRDVPYESFSGVTGFFGNVDRDTERQTAILRYNYAPIESDFIDLEAGITYSNEQIDSTAVGPGADALRNADQQYEILRYYAKNRPYFETGGVAHNMVLGAEFQQRDRATASSAPGGSDDRFAVSSVRSCVSNLAAGVKENPSNKLISSMT
ncbi:MAG: TonB-dependent receptor plug domain-containing protein [Pseudomonadota bacterium]